MKPFVFLALFFSLMISAPSWAQKRLVTLGDSLTEGLGVAKEQAYPALLDKKIKADKKNWVVVNAGVSGSTSASGPSRLKWLMKTKIDMLLLALGANDGLRGLSIEATEKNLGETIEMAQKNGTTVILAGMLMPPNYGKDYTQKFESLFKSLAKKYRIQLIPFLLDKVGGESKFNQTDGMHPNEKGHEIIADNVYAQIKSLLQ